MPSPAVTVSGLSDLQRAFTAIAPTVEADLRAALRALAEPVARDAEALARANIRRIGEPWSQMRVGVTTSMVYVAPKQRGVKSRTDRRLRRPNLFDLLMGRSLEPALERNTAQIEAGVGRVLDGAVKAWEAL